MSGLTLTLEKLRKDEELSVDERVVVSAFVDHFTTVSLDTNVNYIVNEVQKHHHHTKSCRKNERIYIILIY